jgi:hypothetical protein
MLGDKRPKEVIIYCKN